jgi:hypothetical protein
MVPLNKGFLYNFPWSNSGIMVSIDLHCHGLIVLKSLKGLFENMRVFRATWYREKSLPTHKIGGSQSWSNMDLAFLHCTRHSLHASCTDLCTCYLCTHCLQLGSVPFPRLRLRHVSILEWRMQIQSLYLSHPSGSSTWILTMENDSLSRRRIPCSRL